MLKQSPLKYTMTTPPIPTINKPLPRDCIPSRSHPHPKLLLITPIISGTNGPHKPTPN